MRRVQAKKRSHPQSRPQGSEDAQKDRLYAWEESHPEFERNTHSLEDCKTLIEAACELFFVPAPRVTVHYTRSMSFSQTTARDDAVISLQGWGKNGYESGGLNAATALHEAAHHIQYFRAKRTTDHGYAFAALYRALLGYFNILPIQVLDAEWKQFGVRYAKTYIWLVRLARRQTDSSYSGRTVGQY